MFQDVYKSAYDKIIYRKSAEINKAEIAQWIEKEEKRNIVVKRNCRVLKPILTTVFIGCIVIFSIVPTAAATIPGFYEVLERNAPALVDYLVPVQKTDSSKGIIMNLEAAKVEGNTAEILVSFSDEGNNNYIHGVVDMYDSYGLHSYSGESNIAGCSFVEYNAEQDKAYFQIDLISSDGTFDTSRMNFNVSTLLTDCESYTQQILLDDVLKEYDVKAVNLNGGSGIDTENPALEKLTISGDAIDPRPGHLVLDIPLDELSPEEMKITGIAYMDGILRVQLYRGNFKEADRHMNIYMLDETGNEVYPNKSVMWHDTVSGEEVLVDEFYFVITEEQLNQYTLWGEGAVRAGSIKGNWSITFDLE